MSEPQRTCIGCRRVLACASLVRFRAGDGKLSTDPQASGRGVWLCRQIGCLETARKRQAFERALGVTANQQDWEAIAAKLAAK